MHIVGLDGCLLSVYHDAKQNERCNNFNRNKSSTAPGEAHLLLTDKMEMTHVSNENGADDNFFSDTPPHHSKSNSTNDGSLASNLLICDLLKNFKDCSTFTTIAHTNVNKKFSLRLLQPTTKLSYVIIKLISFYVFLLSRTCLLYNDQKLQTRRGSHSPYYYILLFFGFLMTACARIDAYPNGFDKTEKLVDKINLEQSIAAVFNKVAYGSTTKRSIPDSSYPVTTLATPLLTTYRYSDGSDEWLRVDIKNSDPERTDYEDEDDLEDERRSNPELGYGSDLEKDHGLPTSAPAADILKNNNNKNYNNPNRYNNDRLRPDFNLPRGGPEEQVTENIYKTTTSYNVLRNNMRPTKSIYTKDVPSYVPPSRAFFTPPLPPQYINPFADKPTLRGTNSDSFANRRPIPPPSLMPNKDRIPFRPDLPPSKVINVERPIGVVPERIPGNSSVYETTQTDTKSEKKKTLNTPSMNVNLDRLGEFYGLRNLNETNFEYEKGYIPTITRILSGSNGRHDDIPDILLKTVTATPHVQRHNKPTEHDRTGQTRMQDTKRDEEDERRIQESPVAANEDQPKKTANEEGLVVAEEEEEEILQDGKPPDKPEGVTSRKEIVRENEVLPETTTQNSDALNLANSASSSSSSSNVTTKANSNEIWLICWNVHVYLVVLIYIILAIFSIYKLIRYENDPHMFSKSYFLTVHLMLTVICVLRIFYLTYDPYNVGKSFNIFLYEFLHNFPSSLLATTFAVLILFLLKRTLNHLKVKTRPVFLVVFAIMHICLCFGLSVLETLGHFERANLIVCKPVFVLLAWALGFSYLYLYKIIKNVLAKKSQNLSEICTQNISYASHITIAIALLFVLLGFVQLYALFFIKVDRFDGEIRHHWILWGFELSVRLLEISIIALLAAVVSLRMSQREKQTVGFPLFPCTTSDSSTDNIFPNNCATNPNALNYSRNEMIMDNLPSESVDRPNLLKNAFQGDSFEKKSTLERYRHQGEPDFDRFERPKWGSDRFEVDRVRQQQQPPQPLPPPPPPSNVDFDRGTAAQNSLRNSNRKNYESGAIGANKYYTKPKYELEYSNEDYQQDYGTSHQDTNNVYSEPIDNSHYLERNDFERRSKNSSNTSGRRSTGRTRKNHARPHLGVQTLPAHDVRHQVPDTMLVDDQGFVRFRHLQDMEQPHEKRKKLKKQNNDVNHYSDA